MIDMIRNQWNRCTGIRKVIYHSLVRKNFDVRRRNADRNIFLNFVYVACAYSVSPLKRHYLYREIRYKILVLRIKRTTFCLCKQTILVIIRNPNKRYTFITIVRYSNIIYSTGYELVFLFIICIWWSFYRSTLLFIQ